MKTARVQRLPAAEPIAGEACLNCGAALAGPFCARCGQQTPHTDLTLRELVNDTAREITNLDGKVPRTLKALFFTPGLLTVDFLAGRRARWLPPLRVYLLCSLAFFLSKPLVEALTHQSTRELAHVTISNPDGSTQLTPETRREIAEGLPGRIFGPARLERAVANGAQLNKAVDSAYPKAMFVLLPFFALLTSIAWRRKLPRYPAHLYPALHLHAAWFGAFTVSTLASAMLPWDAADVVVGLAVLAYIVWYGLVAAHRIFGDSWGKTLAKAAAIGLVYCVALVIVSIAILAYALFTI